MAENRNVELPAASPAPTRAESSPAQPIIINQHLTKSTFAYQEMRRMIMEGEIEPGQRLILRDIAAQLGLSIQPIRDAIKMLERDGLVDTESHRGAIVTQISGETITELIGIRMWLEILAIEEAVPAHTPESVRVAQEALETAEQELARGGGLAYSQANRRLHEAIEAPAPLLIRQLISDSWEHLWRERRRMSLFELAPTAGPAAQREHVNIVTAVGRGDATGAAQAMARHRESTLAAWRTALAGLPQLPR
jgi:DNA-binding GntR family transcriptional regulator